MKFYYFVDKEGVHQGPLPLNDFLTSSMRHPREIARSTNLDENTIFLQPLVGYGGAILFVSQRVTRMKIITSDYQTVTSAS